MARQTGIFPLKGSIDKVNFYQSRDGDFARKKAKIPLETLLFAPEFENSRKAGKVFGLASTASRLIRSAFSEMILAGSNRDMHNRVLAALQENAKGAERLGQLPFHQLSDFNINRHALFATVCAAPYSVEIKVPGKTTVSFPAFNPRQCLKPPPKSRITHFRLLAGTAVIDCEKHAFKKDVQSTSPIPRKQTLTQPVQLQLSVPVLPGQPWIVAVSVVFSQQVNNSFSESKNEHHQPVLITNVVYEPLPAPIHRKAAKKKKKRSPAKKTKKSAPAQKKPNPRK